MPRALSVLTIATAVLAVLPLPTYALWTVHLAVLELATLWIVVGLAALWLGEWRLATAIALLVHAWPIAAAIPLYLRHGVRFSVAEHLGFWSRDVTVERDVVIDGHRVDLYRPRGAASKLLVVIHGGSWRNGDKGFAPHFSEDAAAHGWLVADVTYRLAPEHRFPAAVEDVKAIAARLRERFRPQRVAYLGRSAGGQIALAAADAGVDAVVALYAPIDLAWGHAHPQVPDIIDGPRTLELYLGGTPQQVPDAYRKATPVSRARTLLVHGTSDRLVRWQHVQRFEGPAERLLIPGADHGFDVRRGGVGEQLARGVILGFLG